MLRQVFAPDMYRFNEAVQSYWEATARPDAYPVIQGDQRFDVAIIGGGYTGLSAALHLAQDGVSVAVLEAGHIGWGASGRNGGFVCYPSAKLGLKGLLDRYGLETTQHFYRTQVEGAELTFSLIKDHGIDANLIEEGNFNVAHHPRFFDGLKEEAAAVTKLFGIRTEVYPREVFAEIGHGGTESFGAMRYWPAGGLHPLKFAIGLGRAASQAGATLFAQSQVMQWHRDGSLHQLVTAGGTIRAKRVILATNGYTPDGLKRDFDRRIVPAISNIIVTQPLTEADLSRHAFATLAPCSNDRRLLFYYRRLPDNRIMLGGRGDTTGRDADGEIIKAELLAGLHRLFPGWAHLRADYFWRGLVCMSRKLTPSIGRLDSDPSIYYALAFHANGVANAPWAGRAVAHAISRSNTGQVAVSKVQEGLPPRMPPFRWTRRLALRAAYAVYRRKDAAEER